MPRNNSTELIRVRLHRAREKPFQPFHQPNLEMCRGFRECTGFWASTKASLDLTEGISRHTTSINAGKRRDEQASKRKQLPRGPAGAHACTGPEKVAFAPHACAKSRCTGFFQANSEIHSENRENDDQNEKFQLEHVRYTIFFTPSERHRKRSYRKICLPRDVKSLRSEPGTAELHRASLRFAVSMERSQLEGCPVSTLS